MTPDEKLIHNETAKLRANAYDRASTACFAVGVFGSVAAVVTGAQPSPAFVLLAAFAWTMVGASLNQRAKSILRGLRA